MTGIVDQYGREITRNPTRPGAGMEAAVPTRQRWFEYPSRGLTPEKLATLLRRADDGDVGSIYELYSEMEEKDLHLASVFMKRRLAVQRLPRQIQARPEVADDPRAQRAVEVVTAALADINMADLILEIMDAVGKGASVLEIGWETGAQFRPYTIDPVDWDLLEWEGRHLKITDGYGANARPPAPNKFIIHTPKLRSGVPSRGGMMRTCTWAYLFKNFAIKDWVTFSEIYAMPLRIGKYDPSASKEDKDALMNALMAIAADAAACIPSTSVIDFISNADKGGADIYERHCEYWDRAISKGVLGETLTTDTSGGTGTRAAGSVHNEVRKDIRDADAESVATTIRRDLFRPIVLFNLGPEFLPFVPELDIDISEPEDRKSNAETDEILSAKIGLKIPVSYLYSRYGIPEPQDGEETVGGRQDAPVPGAVMTPLKRCSCGALSLKAGEEFSLGQQAIESLIAATIEDGQAPIEEILQPFLDAVDEAESFEDLRDRLARAYPLVKGDKFRDLMERAIAMGAAVGYVEASGLNK